MSVASGNDPMPLDAVEDFVESPVNSPHSVLEPPLESKSQNCFPVGPSEKPDLKNPVILEIFCGSARVTACLKMIGLTSSFGVDHIKGKAVSTCKVADLTTQEGQQLLLTWLDAPNVEGVFLAPPCGTCSLARNIILRDSKGRPLPGPVPLRSHLHPEGLLNLSPKNRKRVSPANTLYEFLGKVIRIADSKGLIIVVENPRSSLFWLTKWWKSKGVKLTYTAHQACAYGSERPKWTVLAHNRHHFCKICKSCPGVGKNHVHKPWGVINTQDSSHFATSEETAYPLPLAGAIATAFAKSLMDKGWQPPVDSLDLDWNSVSFAKIRASVGDQPKASKLPPIVREHKYILLIKGPQESLNQVPIKPRERLKKPWVVPHDCDSPSESVPPEAQLLRLSPLRSKGGIHEVDSSHIYEQAWGVPFTPDEFVKEAYVSGHPRNLKNLLPSPLEHAISLNINLPPGDLVSLRAAWFKKWIVRIEELESDERSLKASMPEHLRKILSPKRLLVFREMLAELDYPDLGVFDEIACGTGLAGSVPDSGLFEKVFRPCEITEEQLRSGAEHNRKSIFYSCRGSGDQDVDKVVYEKTIEEVNSGWLRGPFEISSLPSDAIINRRFGLKQPNKVRLIDDFSGSLVNSTVQSFESPKPHSRDVIASVVLSLLSCRDKNFVGRTYDSQKLRGRMQFADGQLFGRLGRLRLRAVTEHAYSGKGPKIQTGCIQALQRFKDFLQHSPPRRIQRSSHKTWLVFTDACYEPTSTTWRCGIGGVIVSPDGTPYQAFSLSLSETQIETLGGSKKDTIIFEAELLAVVVAMGLWGALIQCSPTIFFIDNNAVRDVSISGSGRSPVACCLIEELLQFESDSAIHSWFARVPSPSNPSDKLSRGDLSDLLRWKIQAVNVCDWANVLLNKIPSANWG